jgi:hypothetical protein
MLYRPIANPKVARSARWVAIVAITGPIMLILRCVVTVLRTGSTCLTGVDGHAIRPARGDLHRTRAEADAAEH